MPRYRELTSIEIASEDAIALAEKISLLHGELVKKGLPQALIDSVVDKVAGAAASNSDGWCSPVAKPGEMVSQPKG